MKEIYKKYSSNNQISVTCKSMFTDRDGFLNEKAFHHFVSKQTKENPCPYYLACIIIDLSATNKKKGYEYGSLLLRKAYIQMKEHFFIFRVSGNKFNVILTEEEFESFEKMVASAPSEFFSIYYSIVKEEALHNGSLDRIRTIGIEGMYRNKAERTGKTYNQVKESGVIGEKTGTPAHLQETDTHKYRSTMWCGSILFEEIEPNVRSVKAHVFPVEYKEKQAALQIIVVIDDLINTRVYTGTSVEFGFDNIKFNITARFDKKGHLNIMCFKDHESKGKCEMKLNIDEGVCIPASFGKRVGKGKEIFPIKQNAFGAFEYVLWNKEEGTATYEESGIVQIDGINYAVQYDDEGIDLIEQ